MAKQWSSVPAEVSIRGSTGSWVRQMETPSELFYWKKNSPENWWTAGRMGFDWMNAFCCDGFLLPVGERFLKSMNIRQRYGQEYATMWPFFFFFLTHSVHTTVAPRLWPCSLYFLSVILVGWLNLSSQVKSSSIIIIIIIIIFSKS